MIFCNFFKSGTRESSMRLGFLICVITGCIGGVILAILDVVNNKGKNLLGVASVIAAINAFAFYGKQAQCKIEANNIDLRDNK